MTPDQVLDDIFRLFAKYDPSFKAAEYNRFQGRGGPSLQGMATPIARALTMPGKYSPLTRPPDAIAEAHANLALEIFSSYGAYSARPERFALLSMARFLDQLGFKWNVLNNSKSAAAKSTAIQVQMADAIQQGDFSALKAEIQRHFAVKP